MLKAALGDSMAGKGKISAGKVPTPRRPHAGSQDRQMTSSQYQVGPLDRLLRLKAWSTLDASHQQPALSLLRTSDNNIMRQSAPKWLPATKFMVFEFTPQ